MSSGRDPSGGRQAVNQIDGINAYQKEVPVHLVNHNNQQGKPDEKDKFYSTDDNKFKVPED